MRIVTYQILSEGIFAMTEAEFKIAGGLPDTWDDFIWHENATDKASAIASHDDALDAWNEEASQCQS